MRLNVIPARQYFLIDFIGATISALLLSIVLPGLNSYIQMPINTLYLLALFAGFFAIYSLTCHLRKIRDVPFYLTLIATLNLSYCTAILILCVINFEQLTQIGIVYFILDILVISILAFFEIKAAKRAIS